MATQQDIVNQALAHLGQDPTVTLVAGQASIAVRKMLPFVATARDLVLADHNWLDCMTYETLTAVAAVGDWKYPYRHLLPADCLRLDDAPGLIGPWERGVDIEGGGERRVIKSGFVGALNIAYVRRVDWAMLPVHLEVGVSLLLASLACVPINGDAPRAAALEKRAWAAVARAKGLDGVQSGNQAVLMADRYASIRASAC